MFLQVIVALLIVIGVTFAVVRSDRENPQAVREARQELDNMRSFALSVARFAGSRAEFEGSLSWSGGDGALALRDQETTPEGLRAITLPARWRAQVRAGGDYVLCAPLSEAATALFTAELPDELQFGVARPASGSGHYVVLAGAQDRLTAPSADEPSASTWARTCDQ